MEELMDCDICLILLYIILFLIFILRITPNRSLPPVTDKESLKLCLDAYQNLYLDKLEAEQYDSALSLTYEMRSIIEEGLVLNQFSLEEVLPNNYFLLLKEKATIYQIERKKRKVKFPSSNNKYVPENDLFDREFVTLMKYLDHVHKEDCPSLYRTQIRQSLIEIRLLCYTSLAVNEFSAETAALIHTLLEECEAYFVFNSTYVDYKEKE